MEGWPQLRHFLVFASGVDTICQENNEEFAVGVDPDAGAGKASMTEAVC